MLKLLEKYYNINYYCTYKLLFILCWRMLNPLYLPYSSRALITPFIIICWIFSLVCLVCIKIFKVELSSIFEIAFEKYIIILTSFLVAIGVFTYYVNKIFLFKNDKYEKYFAEFEKEKKYLLYYSIYVVSLIVQFATFYLLLSSA